jgi:DNA-binding LacI/PurR family transcriptional regulator
MKTILSFDASAAARYLCPMKPVTLRQIAVVAGVSLNTVSLALRNSPRLRGTTRAQIQRIAHDLGYVPNPVLAAGMAQLRHRPATGAGTVLALIHLEPKDRLLRWAANRLMAEGIEQRARELGYRIEWMRLSSEAALFRRVENMGIPGAVLIGPPFGAQEVGLQRLIERRPVVSCGFRMTQFPLHMAQSDHYNGVREAVRRVLALGYRRPGLLVHRAFDLQLEQTLTSGFFAGTAELLAIPHPLLDWPDDGLEPALKCWVEQEHPDVILTSEKTVPLSVWRKAVGPHIGLVQLGYTEETPAWAGVTYPGNGIGRTAVELLVAQIHRGETGPPPFQICSLAEGTWIPGTTCPERAP